MPALEKRSEAPYGAWHRLTRLAMKAAPLAGRGVARGAGDDARQFLNGLLTADIGTVTPERARYAALLTPQGKIVVDCIVAQAPAEDGGALFLDCPRALAASLSAKLAFYKLRAKVVVEDLSDTLAVLAAWQGARPPAPRPRRTLPPRLRLIWPPIWSMPPITRPIASPLAYRAAGSISFTATPFRTRPTWTSLPASTSTRAAMWGRGGSRAWSIAAPRAPAFCRSPTTAARPRPGPPWRPG